MRIWSVIKNEVVIEDFYSEEDALAAYPMVKLGELMVVDYDIPEDASNWRGKGYANDSYLDGGRIVVPYEGADGDDVCIYVPSSDEWF